MTFGKNRVQYTDERIWQYYRFQKFDAYFYQGGKEIAINAVKYAEKQLPLLESKLNFTLEGKIQFIVFNSLSELKQSNIGLVNDELFNIGGVTQIRRNTVILYFKGDYTLLEQQIREGISRILINQFFYGSEIASNIKNSTLLYLPYWYYEGLVSFMATEWNATYDNILRDGILSGRYKKFNTLDNYEARIVGHSIWKYISENYDDNAIPNILYLAKLSRNAENSFLFVLGLSFGNIKNEWENSLKIKYLNDVKDRQNLFTQHEIKLKNKPGRKYSQPCLSPDGDKIAYALDILNQKRIYIYDVNTKKHKRIFKLGYKIEEEYDDSYPLINWHPSGELLTFIIEHKGKIKLCNYNLKTDKVEMQNVFGVSKIHSFSYASGGTMMVVAATKNGQSDIFVYNIIARTFEPITKDIYDDKDPIFFNNDNYIVFTSNRTSDTIVFDKETLLKDYSEDVVKSNNFNIYLFNYKTKSKVLWKINNDSLNCFKLQNLNRNKFIFLSDANGIVNRYQVEMDSTISHIDTTIHYRYVANIKPLSDYPTNIIEHSTNKYGDKIGELVYHNNKYQLFVVPVNLISQFEQLSPTSLKQVQIKKDTINKDPKKSLPDEVKEPPLKLQSYPINPEDSLNVNVLITDSLKNKNDTIARQKPFILPNQLNYEVEYSINQLVNQLDYNFINYSYQRFTGGGPVFLGTGTNAFFKIGLNDLLEDYRIIAGFRISFNFVNNEYLLGFENYKSRVNKQILFHRQNNQENKENAYLKTKTNSFFYVYTYPFSQVLSLKTTFLVRQEQVHFLSIDYQNLRKPSENKYWGGIKTELIFDNTRKKQTNILVGTRFKIWSEYNKEITRKHNDLLVSGFDFRHYLPIHRNLIWANRIAGSNSLGKSKLIYYLGGVDNWIFPKFNDKVNISYNKGYQYQTLATNMRGFSQNIRNGNNFVVINSEVRFPFIRYFYNRPIRSLFFDNMQIVAFGDVGTAWEDVNPFSRDNSLFIHYINQNPLFITVRRQKNPIVGGSGLGLRTVFLGYFIRFDVAYGIEDGIVQKPLYYFSLTLDF